LLGPSAQWGDVPLSFWLQKVIPQGGDKTVCGLNALAARSEGSMTLELYGCGCCDGGGLYLEL
jgi:hypothetical protein